MVLLGLNVGLPELIVISLVGVVVLMLGLLPVLALCYMGRPYQALICGLLSLTAVGSLLSIIWVVVVAVYDARRSVNGDSPRDVAG